MKKKDKKCKRTDKDSKSNDKNNYKWAWKNVPPKSGKPWTKKMNEKIYNWSKWHKTWVIHDSNTTSGPTTYKLCMPRVVKIMQEVPSANDSTTGPGTNKQIHAT